jgi:hypothetical protein
MTPICCPFPAGELPFEAIEQVIEQFDLPLVEMGVVVLAAGIRHLVGSGNTMFDDIFPPHFTSTNDV